MHVQVRIVQQSINHDHDKPFLLFKHLCCKHVNVYGQLFYLFVNKTSMGTRPCGIYFKSLWILLVAGVHLIEIH